MGCKSVYIYIINLRYQLHWNYRGHHLGLLCIFQKKIKKSTALKFESNPEVEIEEGIIFIIRRGLRNPRRKGLWDGISRSGGQMSYAFKRLCSPAQITASGQTSAGEEKRPKSALMPMGDWTASCWRGRRWASTRRWHGAGAILLPHSCRTEHMTATSSSHRLTVPPFPRIKENYGRAFPNMPQLIDGDFNVTLAAEDRPNNMGGLDPRSARFREVLAQLGLG